MDDIFAHWINFINPALSLRRPIGASRQGADDFTPARMNSTEPAPSQVTQAFEVGCGVLIDGLDSGRGRACANGGTQGWGW